MPFRSARTVHPAPSHHAGTIHFLGSYAYFQLAGKTSWSLLLLDNPVSAVPNPADAAATAARLQSSYKDSDQVTLHGVLSDQSYDVIQFSTLFLC